MYKLVSILIISVLAAPLLMGQAPEVRLFRFQNSTCDEETDPSRLRTRIVSTTRASDILVIQIASTATCCVQFAPKVNFENGVLNLDFEETGTPCECSCCYEFTYEIQWLTEDKIKFTFKGKGIEQSDEKYKTYPVRFKVINGDTVDYIDRYGFRQGIWALKTDSLRQKRYFEFVDDQAVKRVDRYPNGQISMEISKDKVHFIIESRQYFEYAEYNKLVEFYPSGQKKRECYNKAEVKFNSYEKGTCREWNEQGQLIYEGGFRK